MMKPAVGKRQNTATFKEINEKFEREPRSNGTFKFVNEGSGGVMQACFSPRASGLAQSHNIKTKALPAWQKRDEQLLLLMRDALVRERRTMAEERKRGADKRSRKSTGHLGRLPPIDKPYAVNSSLRMAPTAGPHSVLSPSGVKPFRTSGRASESRRATSLPLPLENEMTQALCDTDARPHRAPARRPLPYAQPEALRGPTSKAALRDEGRSHGHRLQAKATEDRWAVDALRAEQAQERNMLKLLRKNVQRRFTRTTHLPWELWMCYKQADMDNNGRIDFQEFCGICDQISLSDELLGGGGRATLWGYADREGRGTIDFQEFLAAVIGSLSI